VTYYGRSEGEHVNLHLLLKVEGINRVFVTREIPAAPAADGYTQTVCVTRITEGESRLDLDERRETASTLDIEMVDTDDDLFRTYFAAGTRPVAWVSTADATDAADTLIYVNDAAPFDVVGVDILYIGDETMTKNSVDTVLNTVDVLRGRFGSTARSGINGDTSNGDNVFLVPPFWQGRRAYLYGYALDGAGLYTETLLGTYIIDDSPRHVGGKTWALRLAGIAQEYFERSVGLGLASATFSTVGTFDFTGSAPLLEIGVTDAFLFRTSATMDSYVIADTEFGAGIHRLTAVDTLGTITLAYDPSFLSRNALQSAAAVGTVRQIAVVQAPGAASILIPLLSTLGQDLSGGDYLPGRVARDSSDLGWRLGAAFVAGEIDIAAFDAITAIPPMTLIIDGERKVTDLLREWCFLTGTAIVTTVDGKLKPIQIGADRATSERVIGAADIVPEGQVEVTHDEAGIFPIVKVSAGYSPITGEFSDALTLVDVDMAKRYRRAPQTREIEIRGIDVFDPRVRGLPSTGWRNPTRMQPTAMVTMLADLLRASGTGARRLIRLSLSHEHLDLRLGSVVTIGTDLPDAFDDLPDMRGSTIRGATCRVVARRPRYDQARVDVQLEIMDRLLHVCPAAVVASASGATMTLSTTGPEVSGASPTDDFYVGANVLIFDRSTPANYETHDVASISSGTVLTLSGTPAFTIESGVDYIVLNPETSGNGTTASGYSLIEFAKVADAGGTAGVNAATDTQPRWR
jgi:hypothetical protein